MPRAPSELYVYLHGALVGSAVRLRRGAVHFAYDDDYLPSSTPLSLSLPVGQRPRLDLTSWMDGLLPDNPQTRSRWARELGAASTAPFDLLSTRAGLECAGAVQFRTAASLPDSETETLIELTEAEIASMLKLISQDGQSDPGALLGELRLSLPGAQPKMALRHSDGSWHLPTGSLATTHILKPQRGHLNLGLRASAAVNEHLCQTAASMVGLDAAPSTLATFEDEPCLVTERFDRDADHAGVRRVHFEDLCQACGFAPDLKYQADGGPGPETIIRLLRRAADPDSPRRFFLAGCFNWMIGNTDGHSKNYGVVFPATHGAAPRLAPLYDLSSAAPYARDRSGVLPPAMRFAPDNPDSLPQWADTAERLRIDVTADEIEAMGDALPDALAAAAEQCPPWAVHTAEATVEAVTAHVRQVTRRRAAAPSLPSPPPDSRSTVAAERCGHIVRSTGKPCLLDRGHGGRHRSVLPGGGRP